LHAIICGHEYFPTVIGQLLINCLTEPGMPNKIISPCKMFMNETSSIVSKNERFREDEVSVLMYFAMLTY